MTDRMNQCHKCRKTIQGKMVYSGGYVWHPNCYPHPSKIKKTGRKRTIKSPPKPRPAPKRKTRKRPARVEAYTFGEAQRGRGFPW